ncbi:TPA: hypothetical protein DF272_04415 [Candidatus Falkowbacteria bacterium]|nr:hypothetical protein [Candidatus Falkowbacteria bacterium]
MEKFDVFYLIWVVLFAIGLGLLKYGVAWNVLFTKHYKNLKFFVGAMLILGYFIASASDHYANASGIAVKTVVDEVLCLIAPMMILVMTILNLRFWVRAEINQMVQYPQFQTESVKQLHSYYKNLKTAAGNSYVMRLRIWLLVAQVVLLSCGTLFFLTTGELQGWLDVGIFLGCIYSLLLTTSAAGKDCLAVVFVLKPLREAFEKPVKA